MGNYKNISSLLRNCVSLGKEYKTNGKVILCKVCNKSFESNSSAVKKSQIEQHIRTSIHQKNIELKKQKQQMINFDSNEIKFNMDLCDLFVSCDIPLHKLTHEKMKNFSKTLQD